jgi:hypothetical protein
VMIAEQLFVLGLTAVSLVALPFLLVSIANHGKRKIRL